jgi:uncharacterized membrane protein YgdD (TMEM256/DUF423 family)
VGKVWLLSAAIYGALAVALGAFGAHALESHLKAAIADGGPSAESFLDTWEVAARYQMVHALALFGLGLLVERDEAAGAQRGRRLANAAGCCFVFGTLLFSASLYAYVLSKISSFAMITPVGGLLLIAGWIALAGAAIMRRPK